MGIDTSKGVLRIQDRCHGNSTAKHANPCDPAQTRAWVEDYKRWVAGLPAVGDQAQPPDLQALVRMRAATSASPPSSGPNTIERWHGGRRLGGQRIVGAR